MVPMIGMDCLKPYRKFNQDMLYCMMLTCSLLGNWRFVACLTVVFIHPYRVMLLNTTFNNFYFWLIGLGLLVFNVTFNNISIISCQSVLLMEESEVPGENHWPAKSHWQTLSIQWGHVYIRMIFNTLQVVCAHCFFITPFSVFTVIN
jgi:hypothetical protein